MGRAIDADKLLEQLQKKKCGPANKRYTEGFNDCLMRVRSMIHSAPTLTPPNELLMLEELRERDAAVEQKFVPGGKVWVVERDEDGEATEASGFVFVVSVSGVAIVSPSINDCSDLDFILDDFVQETARSYSGDFSGYPISDCYASYEEADAALRREQGKEKEGEHD